MCPFMSCTLEMGDMGARSTRVTKDTQQWPHWADRETNSAPADSGAGGTSPGVSRRVASQLFLKSTAMGGFTEINHRETVDGTGNFLLQDEAGMQKENCFSFFPSCFSVNFVFLIKDYKGPLPFKHDRRFLYRS